MKLTTNTENNYVKSIDINCSPTEWLIISKALKLLSQDKDTRLNDRAKAISMIDIYTQNGV